MNAVVKFAKLHSNALLSGGVVVGIVVSNIMSAKAGAKSARMIDDEERKLGRALTRKEKFKLCWKNYILSTGTQVLSVTGIVGNGYLNMKSNAALLSAYSISQSQLQKLQDKTKEIVGNQKATKIKDEVGKELISENKDLLPANTNVVNSKDNVTFIEPLSKRKFMSNWTTVDRAVNDLNALLLEKRGTSLSGSCYVTVNDWYRMLHLEEVDSSIGETMGWYATPNETWLIDISHSADNDENEQPCAAIYYNHRPKLLSDI